MALPSIFDKEVSNGIISRISQLQPTTAAKWGSMNVAQMLAHCNVTYEMIYENKHPKPGAFAKIMLKAFVKKIVVNETPYKHNSRTAPAFLVTDSRVFEAEKQRLVDHIAKTQQLGASHFEGKESHSFGALNSTEWNNMFYKHLNHHLSQFGV
ncbi:MAG: DUF1569 domain-containing protein [Bacteroidia bacterium]|nr:DUF1569 domain-containing protein [Bacteroidia bacterium]